MYMSGLGSYYLKNGQPTSSYVVGDVMGFDVPGYTDIWLDQYQNGNLQFSGPFKVPMAPYTLLPRDVGSFTASVFKLSPNGKKSDNIGTDQATVLPQAAQVQAGPALSPNSPPPTIFSTLAPAYAPGGFQASGPARMPSGVSVPSSPGGLTFIPAPGGAIDINSPIATDGTPDDNLSAPVQAGLDLTSLALIAGAMFFIFSSRGRK